MVERDGVIAGSLPILPLLAMFQSSKILVTGSSELPPHMEAFAKELGERIISETSAVLVTGGLRSKGAGKLVALDAIVAEAARDRLMLGGNRETIIRRVTTMLPEKELDDQKFQRVEIGNVVRVPYATRRTRRYAMVIHCDAIVAIGGSDATREVIDLAYIAGKPVIPIPSTGGAAEDSWRDYDRELRERLRPTDDEIKCLHDSSSLSRSITACLAILKRVLRPRCFVAMPFHDHPLPNAYETIQAVVTERGYQVIRVDQERFTGSVVEEIWASIQHCDRVIVDLTWHKPNVYYELGIAHALKRPVTLLLHSKDGTVPKDIPFDIQAQRILPFGTIQTLRAHLGDEFTNFGS